VVALSLAVALLLPASAAFVALPEAIDAQQRLRIAAKSIADDIAAAGAGPMLGWGASTAATWPAVLPCRWTGGPLASILGGCARDDAITVLSVAAEAPQGVVETASDASAPLRIAPLSACPLLRSACHLDAGARALVIDGTGRWDIVAVTGVSPDGTEIGHEQDALSRAVAPGALVAEVSVRGYRLKLDPSTGVLQLRRGTGVASDAPLADQVTGLSFAYVARAAPPVVIVGEPPERRSTTYGPLPPRLDVDDPSDTWPAGENCVFRVEDHHQVSRLAPLAADDRGLAALPLALLADGPWCPDEQSPNRWDADLLRIRLVRVWLRVQPPAVHRPGPELEVRLDVGLRSQFR
jgi:hypothetical protein